MSSASVASKITALDKGYNPTDVYNNITTKLGIPDARTRVQALQSNLLNTENAIRAVDPNVTARTSSSLVTEAQRGALVNMEKAPLTDTYNQQNQAYGTEQGHLVDLTGQATQQAGLAESNYSVKRQSLADRLTTALKKEEIRRQKKSESAANKRADRDFKERQREFNVGQSNANYRANLSGGGSSSSKNAVNPARDFLDYIGGQFKAAGGAGNKKVTRQQQDSWADAWFKKNGVSKAHRQQYWNLYNKTYNRSDDPTKDWRYAK